MRLVVIAIATAGLVLAGCGGDSESGGSEEAATIEIEGQAANDEGSEEVTSEAVELQEGDYYFEPTILTGEAGQKVTLEITNEGDEEHNITIDDQGIDDDTEPGDSTTVEAEVPDSGAIVFYCSYHDAENMRGALAVTGYEPASSSAESSSGSGGYGSGGY